MRVIREISGGPARVGLQYKTAYRPDYALCYLRFLVSVVLYSEPKPIAYYGTFRPSLSWRPSDRRAILAKILRNSIGSKLA